MCSSPSGFWRQDLSQSRCGLLLQQSTCLGSQKAMPVLLAPLIRVSRFHSSNTRPFLARCAECRFCYAAKMASTFFLSPSLTTFRVIFKISTLLIVETIWLTTIEGQGGHFLLDPIQLLGSDFGIKIFVNQSLKLVYCVLTFFVVFITVEGSQFGLVLLAQKTCLYEWMET